MEIQNFEEKLTQMTKPEVKHLKHQDLFAGAIIKAKDKSVISWWWLSIPLYILAALFMKSLFMPQTTWLSNIHELTGKEKYTSFLLFLFLPVLFIIINLISIQKIHFLSGNPKTISFLKAVWFNVLIIILCILIIVLFSL